MTPPRTAAPAAASRTATPPARPVPGRVSAPGQPFPLGATPGEHRALRARNFAIASSVASSVTLVPVRRGRRGNPDPGDRQRRRRLACASCPASARARPTGTGSADPGIRPRACAATRPSCCSTPTPRRSAGTVTFGPEVLGQDAADPGRPSSLDSAGHVPRSLVVDPAFSWQDGKRPWHRYADTVVYEVHVKGFTMRHPDIPPELRGTYAGLGHDAAIAHLTDLGVTTVELLPVHQNVPEAFLVAEGLTNYWGYNTIGFFAPHNGYSAAVRAGRPGGQVAEFKTMVDALHRAGLEVILDVVFNHTAEAGPDGPTLCFRGLDNLAYYRVVPGDPGTYYDTTGCGNSLNAGDPITLQLMHGLAALLADRDARRRVPVRPGPHPGPPGRRLRQGVGLLGHVLPGPGGVPGQADRRAVGRRPDGQLRPGPVPAAVAGVERQVPGHHARLLAQPPGRASASSPTASPARPTCTPPPAAGPPPRST